MTTEAIRGRVVRLRIAPVKGLALLDRDAVEVGRDGVPDDRRFYLLGPDGRPRSGLAHGPLVRIVPQYDRAAERLTLVFPSGRVVTADAAGTGKPLDVPWGERLLRARPVPGFDEALSAYVGTPLRLVRAEPGHRPSSAQVTILSTASVEALERGADLPDRLDDRRFRMLITIDGVASYAEEAWVGSEVAVGDAILRVDAPAARCATTTRDPATGLRDIDVLRLLADVRGPSPRKTLDLGVYCDVVRPGRVQIGDSVSARAPGESAA